MCHCTNWDIDNKNNNNNNNKKKKKKKKNNNNNKDILLFHAISWQEVEGVQTQQTIQL